jgi:cytochrome b561
LCDQSQLTTKVPKHLPGPAWEKYSAQAVHALMYPLMFSIPATGVLMGYFGGSGIPFFGLRIPGKEKTTDADMQVCTMQFGVLLRTFEATHRPVCNSHRTSHHFTHYLFIFMNTRLLRIRSTTTNFSVASWK